MGAISGREINLGTGKLRLCERGSASFAGFQRLFRRGLGSFLFELGGYFGEAFGGYLAGGTVASGRVFVAPCGHVAGFAYEFHHGERHLPVAA
jgi:hypothetical protein